MADPRAASAHDIDNVAGCQQSGDRWVSQSYGNLEHSLVGDSPDVDARAVDPLSLEGPSARDGATALSAKSTETNAKAADTGRRCNASQRRTRIVRSAVDVLDARGERGGCRVREGGGPVIPGRYDALGLMRPMSTGAGERVRSCWTSSNSNHSNRLEPLEAR